MQFSRESSSMLRQSASILALGFFWASTAQAQTHSADPFVPGGPKMQAEPPTGWIAGATDAVDFVEGSGLCGINQDQSIGWQFNVDTEITVTAMSWYDELQDGLEIGHEVAIWDPLGNLIASTNVTIPAGTAATLEGIWRTVAITPTTLPVGSGYIVGGYNNFHSECLNFNVTQTVIPEITYIDATFSGFGATLERPINFSAADNGFYGVGFQVGEGLGTKYCMTNANSTGSPADIAASGSASSGAGDLTLDAAPVPNQPGIFFHGNNQVQQPFGNGFLCASGAIARGAVVVGAGNNATYTYDNSGAKRDLSSYIGSMRNFQYWFRDPAGGGANFNLSNAIAIDILP